jgi:hypothetical protein
MPSHREKSTQTCESAAPKELRGNLEVTRIQLLALFRSLDLLGMAQELPVEIRTLFELDATLAEALWVLDQPLGDIDVGAMTQDSLASIEAVIETMTTYLKSLPEDDRIRLAQTVIKVHKSLTRRDAYNQIPGIDPDAG